MNVGSLVEDECHILIELLFVASETICFF